MKFTYIKPEVLNHFNRKVYISAIVSWVVWFLLMGIFLIVFLLQLGFSNLNQYVYISSSNNTNNFLYFENLIDFNNSYVLSGEPNYYYLTKVTTGFDYIKNHFFDFKPIYFISYDQKVSWIVWYVFTLSLFLAFVISYIITWFKYNSLVKELENESLDVINKIMVLTSVASLALYLFAIIGVYTPQQDIITIKHKDTSLFGKKTYDVTHEKQDIAIGYFIILLLAFIIVVGITILLIGISMILLLIFGLSIPIYLLINNRE